MPLYEYECSACKKRFEQLAAMSQTAALPACPHCGSTHTQKRIAAVATSGGCEAPASSRFK
jgi:putative FmdB family regulatory protein